MILDFVRHPRYMDAHPGEGASVTLCEFCTIARNPDSGKEYLLWRSNDSVWALSRHDPAYGTSEQVEVTELRNAP